MTRRKRNGEAKRLKVWMRCLAGTLVVVGVALLVFLGPGAILSDGEREPGLIIGVEEESAPTAKGMADALEERMAEDAPGDLTDADAQDVPRLSLPSPPVAPGVDFEISASEANAVGGDFEARGTTTGISARGERIDLEQIRARVQSEQRAGERVEDARGEPGWEHEITVGRRGSLRIGYQPAGGSEASDPLSGTLEAEFVVDLFGKASVSAGYRFLNFRDLEGNQELRDALARAQVQVRF